MTFFYIFLFFFIVGIGLQYWLSLRQIHWVCQHRNQVPKAFEQSIDLAAHQKAADYTVAKERFALLERAASTLLLIAWTFLGGLHLLNQTLWTSIPDLGPIQGQLLLFIAFIVVNILIGLPFSLYKSFCLESRFGFNKMTLKLWFKDSLKGVLLSLLLGLPLGMLILWLMAQAGPYWWLYAWVIFSLFQLLMLWLYPTFIAPWFNKFTPLQDEKLKQRIQSLMKRTGFTAKKLFVVDGSRRSTHANAYFTGIGTNKRIVFYDTLLQQVNNEEIEAVLAHELGHFKHRHIQKRMFSGFIMSLLGFMLLGWLSNQTWFYTSFGIELSDLSIPTDALALILFSLVIPVFGFFISPIFSWFSRKHEFEADRYAKQHSNKNALIQALLKLYKDNASTLTPDRLYVAFYYSHPPASQRIAHLA
jgi:STE24 endopeptidase